MLRLFTLACSALLATQVLAADFGGTWTAQRAVDGTDVSYEMSLTQRGSTVLGWWTVDASRPSVGCVRGTTQSHEMAARMCRLDGSVGAKDSKDVCPEYQSGRNQFIRRGVSLLWQTRASGDAPWRTLVVLTRAAGAPRSSAPEECKEGQS
jgi:hypothetical protein